MSSENEIKQKPLTMELSNKAQLALLPALYSTLLDRTKVELRSADKNDENTKYLKEQNQELRTMLITIATNLGKTDQFIQSEKIAMGLVDLLTEEELREVAMDSKNTYHMHATYLLKTYKYK